MHETLVSISASNKVGHAVNFNTWKVKARGSEDHWLDNELEANLKNKNKTNLVILYLQEGKMCVYKAIQMKD